MTCRTTSISSRFYSELNLWYRSINTVETILNESACNQDQTKFQLFWFSCRFNPPPHHPNFFRNHTSNGWTKKVPSPLASRVNYTGEISQLTVLESRNNLKNIAQLPNFRKSKKFHARTRRSSTTAPFHDHIEKKVWNKKYVFFRAVQHLFEKFFHIVITRELMTQN